MADAVLALEALTAGYDEAAVIRDVDLTVDAGRGRRPARARTARARRRRCASSPASCSRWSGRILFGGDDLARTSPSARARLGIAHVPEGRGLFFGMTVAEHFRVGPRGEPTRRRRSPTSTSRSWRSCRGGGSACSRAASSRCSRSPARWPGEPKLLLLDEMSLGLAPVIVERLLPVVRAFAGRAAAAPCCSSSSTCTWRSRSPTAATSCRTAGSCSTTTRSTCAPTGSC